MIDKAKMAEVAAYNDAESEEFEDMKRFWKERDVNVEDLVYVADQRALRLVMMTKGISPNVQHATPVSLTAEDKTLHTQFMLAFLDGMAIGMGVGS